MQIHLDLCGPCRARLLQQTGSASAPPRHSRDAETRQLQPGRGMLVGRYVIHGLVGRGAMGLVYAAYDPELLRSVALKLLRLDEEQGPPADPAEARRQLVQEARAMACIAHRNVIAVHEVGTFRDEVFIAMEFIDGTTLREWLSAGKRACSEIVEVFVQAGRGLAAAHAAGLVHRDFKPDNVLVARDGRVCVTDFGLARRAPPGLGEAATSGAALAISASRAGTAVGTPAYMAPEQHLRRPADARSDQFSFCVALYEALYGVRPFPGRGLAEVTAAVLAGRLREPPALRRTPRHLERALRRGLSREPAQRFAAMEPLLAALSSRDLQRRRWPLLLGAALGMLAVLAALALLSMRGHATAFP